MERDWLDVLTNETIWTTSLYVDTHGRLKGKNVNKDGQHTLAVDAKTRYVYA